jgi:WD40 repeat protein
MLWDAATGKAVATLEGHKGWVSAVAFSPDGQRVLTGSDDKKAILWDAATGKAVATLEGHKGSVLAVAFSPDGHRVLTGSGDNTAMLWAAFPSAQALVEEVKASLPRCLTPEERKRFHLRTAAPLWCHARNLWPYADHGPTESEAASPPYGPPAMTWDERLIALWDRSSGWLAGPDTRIIPTVQSGTKSP